MKLADGAYKTKHGSTVILSKNGGVSEVNFDWFEEPEACYDCQVNVYPDDDILSWYCEQCGGGSALLHAAQGATQ